MTNAERLEGRAAAPSVAGRSVVPAVRGNQEILGNAASLVATTASSALLGFAYWAVAARLFTQEAVGYAAASVSAMTLLGTIGMFGLGTLLIAELPKRDARANLISAALLASGVGSLIIGLAFVLVAPHLSASFRNSVGTLAGASIFTVGVVITAACLVFDQATIGLLRGGLQLARNIGFAILKLAALPGAAYLLHAQFGLGISLAWIAGLAISLAALAIWLWWRGSHVFAEPDWRVLRRLGKAVAAHNWLNLAAMVPTLLIPILVTVLVSPSANGAFYAAWMLVQFLYLLPTHLSTVLFAVAANDPQALARRLRFTLAVSLLIGLPGMAILGLGAHLWLSIFGSGYAREGTTSLSLLVLAYIPMIPRTHYIAVCRAVGKIPRAAIVLTGAALLELAAVVLGAKWNGLAGLSLALVGARFVAGMVTTPPVIRAALSRGRHRRDEPRDDLTETARAGPDLRVLQTSQEAGLALLLLLSTPEALVTPPAAVFADRHRGAKRITRR